MAKSDNLLAILWMLRSRRRMTASQIARELSVDVRTVYRYIDALSYSGAPVIAEPGPNGGYSLVESFRDTPLFFTTAERIALAHAGLFARQAGYPYTGALSTALTKVERHLSPEQLADLQRHASGLDVINSSTGSDLFSVGEDAREVPPESDPRTGAPPRAPGLEAMLTVIEEAVAERRRITIVHHRNPYAPAIRRQVDPYGLIYWRENWYLIGYCHLRKDLRTFRCDRLVTAKRTEKLFQRPDGFSARDHFLRAMVPKEAARDEVTIRVRGSAFAIDSLSRHWFLSHFIREQSERELAFAVDVEEANEYLGYLVLSFASELTIVEPASLRAWVARIASAIAEEHGPGATEIDSTSRLSP